MVLQKSRVGVVGGVRQAGIVGRLEDRGIVRFDDAARFPREQGERVRNRLRRAVGADDPEGQLVRRAVEGRRATEVVVVIGPAPPVGSEAPLHVQAFEHVPRVAGHLHFAQAGIVCKPRIVRRDHR